MDLWDLKYHFELAVGLAAPSARVQVGAGGAGWEAVGASGEVVGWAGALEADAPPWAARLYGFELGLELAGLGSVPYRPLPVTPPVERDVALVLPPGVTAAQVDEAVRRAAGPLLESFTVFDEYRGPGIAADHRSVAWHCSFRDPGRTLREQEVDAILARALGVLEEKLGVRRRAG